MSTELEVRLSSNPKIRDALNTLPPKMLSLTSGKPPEPRVIEVDAEKRELQTRVDRVEARIRNAIFGNPNDKTMVPKLYKDYVARVAGALQPLLARQMSTRTMKSTRSSCAG